MSDDIRDACDAATFASIDAALNTPQVYRWCTWLGRRTHFTCPTQRVAPDQDDPSTSYSVADTNVPGGSPHREGR